MCAFVCVEINCFSVALNFFCTFAFAGICYICIRWYSLVNMNSYTSAYISGFLGTRFARYRASISRRLEFLVLLCRLLRRNRYLSQCVRALSVCFAFDSFLVVFFFYFVFPRSARPYSNRMTFPLFRRLCERLRTSIVSNSLKIQSIQSFCITIQATCENATFSNNIKDRTPKTIVLGASNVQVSCRMPDVNERKQWRFGSITNCVARSHTKRTECLEVWTLKNPFFVIMNIREKIKSSKNPDWLRFHSCRLGSHATLAAKIRSQLFEVLRPRKIGTKCFTAGSWLLICLHTDGRWWGEIGRNTIKSQKQIESE